MFLKTDYIKGYIIFIQSLNIIITINIYAGLRVKIELICSYHLSYFCALKHVYFSICLTKINATVNFINTTHERLGDSTIVREHA